MNDKTPTRKIVILARGLGTRMRADNPSAEMTTEQRTAAEAGMKAMMPIDRPFLDYCLSAYAEAGFTQACLVIGPEHTAVAEYYRILPTSRISVTTAIQERALGTADAVLAAEDFAAGERIAVVNGDNYYPADVMRRVREESGNVVAGFDRESLVSGSNIPANRLRSFALLVSGSDDILEEFVEKPDQAQFDELSPRATVSMNCFGFTPEVFAAARAVEPSTRGELEIVDAVRLLAGSSPGVRVLTVHSGVLDLSNRNDVASVTEHLAGSEVRL